MSFPGCAWSEVKVSSGAQRVTVTDAKGRLLLSFLGALCGLVLGKLLHLFIMCTIAMNSDVFSNAADRIVKVKRKKGKAFQAGRLFSFVIFSPGGNKSCRVRKPIRFSVRSGCRP